MELVPVEHCRQCSMAQPQSEYPFRSTVGQKIFVQKAAINTFSVLAIGTLN